MLRFATCVVEKGVLYFAGCVVEMEWCEGRAKHRRACQDKILIETGIIIQVNVLPQSGTASLAQQDFTHAPTGRTPFPPNSFDTQSSPFAPVSPTHSSLLLLPSPNPILKVASLQPLCLRRAGRHLISEWAKCCLCLVSISFQSVQLVTTQHGVTMHKGFCAVKLTLPICA